MTTTPPVHSTPSTYLCATRSPCLRPPSRDALTAEATSAPGTVASAPTTAAAAAAGGVLGRPTTGLVGCVSNNTDSLNNRSFVGNGSIILRMSSSNVSFTSSRTGGGGGGGEERGTRAALCDRTNEIKLPWQTVDDRVRVCTCVYGCQAESDVHVLFEITVSDLVCARVWWYFSVYARAHVCTHAFSHGTHACHKCMHTGTYTGSAAYPGAQ